VTLVDLLPELRFTDSGLIWEGRANVAYETIDAITFKLLPLIRNRLSRAFYGVDTTVVFGSNRLMPKIGSAFGRRRNHKAAGAGDRQKIPDFIPFHDTSNLENRSPIIAVGASNLKGLSC
jgi:hypothetical protein